MQCPHCASEDTELDASGRRHGANIGLALGMKGAFLVGFVAGPPGSLIGAIIGAWKGYRAGRIVDKLRGKHACNKCGKSFSA